MICNKCIKRPATVLMTKIINNKKVEISLCQQCASEDTGLNINFESQMLLHKFLSGLLGNNISNQVNRTLASQCQCSSCGLSYNEFTKNGKLGCGQCYQDFEQFIQPLLGRIHGAKNHTGKIPLRAGAEILVKKEIDEYRKRLQEAINKEEFEEAAVLRDQIKEIEKRITGGM